MFAICGMVRDAHTIMADLLADLLETWRIHDEIHRFILDVMPEASMKDVTLLKTGSPSKGRHHTTTSPARSYIPTKRLKNEMKRPDTQLISILVAILASAYIIAVPFLIYDKPSIGRILSAVGSVLIVVFAAAYALSNRSQENGREGEQDIDS